jgi:hypothetical protein
LAQSESVVCQAPTNTRRRIEFRQKVFARVSLQVPASSVRRDSNLAAVNIVIFTRQTVGVHTSATNKPTPTNKSRVYENN